MSKIQPVNYQIQPKSAPKHGNYAAGQSFGSGVKNNPLVEKMANSFKTKMMTKRVTFLDYLNLKDGEMQNQVITALFTMTLAPTMIAFNPFCDKPEKTKKYLAFRQFVSAAIAISITLPLTKLVNKQIARIGSKGYIDSIDIRMAPHRDYLNEEFEKKYTNAKKSNTLKQFEVEVGLTDERITALRDKAWFNPKKSYYKSYLEKYFVEKKQTEANYFFANLISKDVFDAKGEVKTRVENGTGDIFLLDKDNKPAIRFCKSGENRIKILDENGKVIKLDKIKTAMGEVASDYLLEKDIPRIKTIEQLKKYVSQHSIHKRTFREFMKDNFGFKFYHNGKIQHDSTLTKIENTNIKVFLEAIGLNKNIKADDIRKVVGKAYQSKFVKELKNILGENKEKQIVNLAEAINKTISRLIQHENGETNSKKINASLNQFMERTDFLEQFMESNGQESHDVKIKQLQELMNSPIAKVMEKLKETFEKQGLGTLFENEKSIEGITERYVKKSITTLTEKFKNTSKFYSLVVAAGITVFTCSVLNWLYPRIIEKFLPQLLVKDEPSEVKKGGNE